MRARSLFGFALVTAGFFAGCSSSGSGGTSNTTPSGPIALADLPGVYASAMCDNLAGCCQSEGYAFDPAKCEAAVTGFMGLFTGLVNKGTVKYDANAAGTCMAEVPSYAKGCLKQSLGSAACEAVFTGTVPQGGACTQSTECIAPPGGGADCDQGKCVPETRGVAGDPCKWTCTESGSLTTCGGFGADQGAECFTNDGLYCNTQSQKCETRVAIGAQGCDGSGESCVDGAYCEGTACVAQKALGASCTNDGECNATAYCAQTCQSKKPLGASCQSQDECIDGDCDGNKCAKNGNTTLGIFCGAGP